MYDQKTDEMVECTNCGEWFHVSCIDSGPIESLAKCCPKIKESTGTRVMYTTFIVFGFIIAFMMLSPQFENKIHALVSYHLPMSFIKIPQYNETCVFLKAGVNCNRLTGYQAVYRLSMGMVAFHFILMLVTVHVRSSSEIRGTIQNGFWFFKFLLLLACCAGAFYVPKQYNWMYVGMVGGFLFIIMQLILLVDFCHSWNASWYDIHLINGITSFYNFGVAKVSCHSDVRLALKKARKVIADMLPLCCLPQCSLCLLCKLLYGHFAVYLNVLYVGCVNYYTTTLLFTSMFYLLVIFGTIMLYFNYTSLTGCNHNKVFIGVNAGLCVLLSLITLLPCTQKCNAECMAAQMGQNNSNTSMLQASVISLYVVYLTWSALSSEPPEEISILETVRTKILQLKTGNSSATQFGKKLMLTMDYVHGPSENFHVKANTTCLYV
ncbi:hypothetical protein KUTeg_017741 [Tegillarca granosa]|uniref:Serine incorporator 5 n=1 Tax=Tegillarca granosa TaxID=220873 RepID=A0ABQ9EFT8_TEGGR|nr:hypothetical protein KUTeg_017741 [Tegillarca granosa]